jgi:hypothetical protein
VSPVNIFVVDLEGGWADVANPRIDLITHAEKDGLQYVRVIYGTPTPNARLDNLLGAPSLPEGETPIAWTRVEQASGRHHHTITFTPKVSASTAGYLNWAK